MTQTMREQLIAKLLEKVGAYNGGIPGEDFIVEGGAACNRDRP